MILGLLAERGPMHGHQIRRTAELTNAGVWGGITGGALYAELRKLDGEGLVEAIREEQVGRRPARTVYQITQEGRLELIVQRDAALEVVFGSADPMSVVLLFAAGADASELAERLAARRHRVAGQLEAMSAERERLTRQGILPPLAVAAFRRGELRLEAELRWHEEFERQLEADPPGRLAAGARGGRPARPQCTCPRDVAAPGGESGRMTQRVAVRCAAPCRASQAGPAARGQLRRLPVAADPVPARHGREPVRRHPRPASRRWRKQLLRWPGIGPRLGDPGRAGLGGRPRRLRAGAGACGVRRHRAEPTSGGPRGHQRHQCSARWPSWAPGSTE